MFDDLETIYIVFQSFVTNREKVEYLEKLRDRNLDYDINYDNLIKLYS
jgi:hypothetical protein